MPSFLHLLAQDLLLKSGGDFSNLTVIFPNKRAGLFLADEMAGLISNPVWMPEIITMAEFISGHTGLKKADDLALIIKLYKAYTTASRSQEQFEDFYFWGNMLLGDFDDADKYLANAKDLFSNLASLNELETSFPYLTPEQIEVIQTFWRSFRSEKFSREQEEFLKVWDKLHPTYTAFRENLFRENLCYEGMGQRYFCEHLDEYDHPGRIVFAGFNALNTCEKKIFSHYRDNGKASFYWDYDLYYSANENHEAGQYIRENLKLFPNELDISHFNNFRNNGKKIEFISVPSAIGQAKLIPTLTAGITPGNERDTAIVLCDERMLIPVMHSIPENILKINITMGYPAQNTSIAALIVQLCDLRSYAKKEGEETFYYYKPVVALLTHKLIKKLCGDDIDRITAGINRENTVYVAAKDLTLNEITRMIFSPDEGRITDYLIAILSTVIRNLHDGTEEEPTEKEFAFTLYTAIQSLSNLFREEGIEPADKLYGQIIGKIINNTTVPFSGEPLEGLQLMGLMETRMLDFSNLILLSVNEGILPKNSVSSSFIPYNLRVGFRLPTPEHQDALFAYYFYRLLQRAQNIRLLYTSGTKGINSGEMSRFLYQLKYESELPITEKNFQNRISTQDNRPIEIAKNAAIIAQLDGSYTQSADNTLSPSALNTYMECPLRFYFRYIAGIKEKEEIAEELDHRLLGNIFHECSQSLYATIPDRPVTAEAIDRLLADERLIDSHIRASYLRVYDRRVSALINSGNNDLILNIIKKYIRGVLTYDRQFCPFTLEAMEEKFSVPVEIGLPEARRTVFVGGIIDRVDRTDRQVRIIDYKTGADTTLFKNIPALFDQETPHRNKAAFQTMLYCVMFGHSRSTPLPLTPGIYSTKLIFTPDYNYMLRCEGGYVSDFGPFRDEFTAQLTSLLEEIWSPTHPFRQTTNDQKCRNCPYSSICRR